MTDQTPPPTPLPRRKPKQLTVRQECALGFAVGILASPYGEAILKSNDTKIMQRVCKRAVDIADIFLEVSA